MNSNIGFNFIVNRGGKLAKSLLCAKPQTLTNFKGIKYAPLAEDVASFSESTLPKASVFLEIKQMICRAPKIIQENFSGCNIVNLVRCDKAKKIVRMNAGVDNTDLMGKRICCYLDNKGGITQALMLDPKSRRIEVVDFTNGLKRSYSTQEVNALHYYKYHPDSIHASLRQGRNIYSGELQSETTEAIKTLKSIFSNEGKVSKNNERKTIYRALQGYLSNEERSKLQEIGGIFTDKSFCSTTTDLSVAKRFANNSPILGIDFPKGAEYLDMDKLFNIDRQHWLENELLLDKGAKFQVTGFDRENNVVKVKYLL